MRKRLLFIITVAIFTGQDAIAQTFLPPAASGEAKTETAPEAAPTQPIIEIPQSFSPGWPQIWARTEYLLWGMQDSPLPIPLVTTGSPANPVPGALGQPGTFVALGGSGFRHGAFSGLRITLGGWCDSEQLCGVEGSGFLLERRAERIYITSDNKGNPLLALSFINTTTAPFPEAAHLISNPARNKAGNVLVASSVQLWGAEVNDLLCLWREPRFECDFLIGFRYADLYDKLRILKNTLDIAAPPVASTVTTLDDNFNTRNQFYGGQLGARVNWQWTRYTLDVTGKVALGATHQVIDVQGYSSQSGPAATRPGSFIGGLYAQRSNIGRSTSNPFTVIPSMEMKLGCHFCSRVRGFIGYDFLNWYDIVRPGNQIDRGINLSQSPILGTTNGVLAGSAQPTSMMNRSDFWAHGVSFGLEFRY